MTPRGKDTGRNWAKRGENNFAAGLALIWPPTFAKLLGTRMPSLLHACRKTLRLARFGAKCGRAALRWDARRASPSSAGGGVFYVAEADRFLNPILRLCTRALMQRGAVLHLLWPNYPSI